MQQQCRPENWCVGFSGVFMIFTTSNISLASHITSGLIGIFAVYGEEAKSLLGGQKSVSQY
jgi:hypothetical protein